MSSLSLNQVISNTANFGAGNQFPIKISHSKMLLYKVVVAQIIILAANSLLFFNCSNYPPIINDCVSVKLKYNVQYVQAIDNQLFSTCDSLCIFYLKNYTIYRLPIHKTNYTGRIDTNGKISHYKVIREFISYQYFVSAKGDSSAFLFDSLTAKTPHKIAIDSFLTASTFKGFPFYKKDNDTLLTAKRSKGGELVEKHIHILKIDQSYPDTDYYYYRPGFNNISYSFSKILDSTRHLKLYKVEFIYNPIPKSDGNIIPKRVFQFEIENNVDGIEEVRSLVSRFKKDRAVRSL